MNEFDARMIDLEIRITHQDRLIEELSDVVHADSRRIAELEKELRQLRKVLETLGPDLTPSPDE